MRIRATNRVSRSVALLTLMLGVLGTLWFGFFVAGHLFLGSTEFALQEGTGYHALAMLSGAGWSALKLLPCLGIAYLAGQSLRA